MDRYRLKNIIILILALMNLFLLGSLAQRKCAEEDSRARAVEQLTELFAADGITLEKDAIPKTHPPKSYALTRNTDEEAAAAAFLLGSSLQHDDQGGGIHTYNGPRGTAMFRSNGSFDAVGTMGSKERAMDICREFCRRFGYEEPSFQLDSNGSGCGVAVRRWKGLPVFNCTLTFTLIQNTLTSVSGTLIPNNAEELPIGDQPLSALAALTIFQSSRRENGAVVTDIQGMKPCYDVQSTTAVPLSLTPAWCIFTSTAKYYVNALTGTVYYL